jgi:alkylation response protein AidB-like acyl-CoA dehydrogenase
MLVCDIFLGQQVHSRRFVYTGIGTMPITLYGSEEQNKTVFQNLFQVGVVCIVLTEPGAGSDPNWKTI